LSRIVALLNRDRRPADLGTLRKLVAPLRIRGSDEPRLWLSGAAGLAYQCLRTSVRPDELQPAELGKDLSICFDGRLDNREELIAEFRAELTAEPTSLPDAFFVMACYRRYGEQFAEKLNGDFALALFDRDKQQMLLARDVMGVRPLYYWVSGDTFIAASEIKAILAHPGIEPQPDEDALADRLVGGDPNELRLTLFRGVRRVLPGHTVIVEPNRIREFQHWDFDPTRQVRCGSVAEYADGLRGLFEQAVRRRLRSPGPVGVTVSGGLDSSAILCQAAILVRAGEPIPAAYGFSQLYLECTPADERGYLSDIELERGLAIRRLTASPMRYLADMDRIRTVEWPLLPSSSFLDLLATARNSSCTTMLSGYFGDQILASDARLYELLGSFRWLGARKALNAFYRSYTDSNPNVLRQELLRAFIRDFVPDQLMKPFRRVRRMISQDHSPGWYSRRVRDIAYRRSQQQRRPAGPFASKQSELCYVEAHAAHITRMMELSNKLAASYGQEMAYPFADRDLIAFVMAIPGEIVTWKGVYKGLYREAMRGILPERIRLRYCKADFTHAECDAAAALSTTGFENKLGPDAMAVRLGWVDRAKLRISLSRARAGLTGQTIWPALQLNELLALEIWLQCFFGDKAPDYKGIGL
jgi:asparagine synthase (glutamine-hydrolysing)